jgi:transcriptional regulator of met regulon
MSYKDKFINGVLESSMNSNWQQAKQEWVYISSYEEHGNHCLCGHSIFEVCVCENIYNGFTIQVGNCCVKKFMSDTSLWPQVKQMSSILHGIKNNILYSINIGSLYDFFLKNVITEWEFQFYQSIGKKRNLSEKQKQIKTNINLKIFKNITKR